MAKVLIWRGRPMLHTKFRHILVNEAFRFASEVTHPFSGMMLGPWVKTGPRTYMHAHKADPHVYRVGTINVNVIAGPGIHGDRT